MIYLAVLQFERRHHMRFIPAARRQRPMSTNKAAYIIKRGRVVFIGQELNNTTHINTRSHKCDFPFLEKSCGSRKPSYFCPSNVEQYYF
jgi:hypothetical protein